MFPALSDPSTHERAVRSIEALPCPDLSVWVSVGTNHNSMADESGNQGRAGSSGEGSPQELQDSVPDMDAEQEDDEEMEEEPMGLMARRA